MLVRVKAIRRFTVRAVLPDTLSALEEIAGNLRWSWHEPTKELFARISPELWQEVEHDPIALLGSVEPARLAELAGDQGYVDWANHVRDELRAYIHDPRWYQSLGDSAPAAIAYFSPEFGIASSLPQYSGGLGILAGDHLKAASDLGAPLVAVGLFYRSGYFAQAITPDGWQLESYPALDPDGLPLSVLRDPDGAAVQITLALPAG
jgi:starch phosphorylase